jgi:hypothetical protein
MVEFVVAAGVLVPMLLVLGLLARYLDVWQATEAASRYVAFEGQARNTSNSWKSDAELSAEVRRRFFSRSNAPIKTGDTAGNFAAHRNPYWTTAAGVPLIDRFEDQVTVKTTKEGKVAIAAAETLRRSLDFSNDNLLVAEVNVKLANVARLAPFDALDLQSRRKTVMLVDTWTARSADQVRGKIQGSLALYPLGRIKPLVDLVGLIPPAIYDPALVLSAHDWDVVPCDRLVDGC